MNILKKIRQQKLIMLRSSNQLKKISRSLIEAQKFSTTAKYSSKLTEEWKKLATAQLKDKSPDTLLWHTAEVYFSSKEFFIIK